MATYSVYCNGDYVGTLETGEGGGFPQPIELEMSKKAIFQAIILFLNIVMATVLSVMCYKVYFTGNDHIMGRIAGAIPLIISIALILLICYFNIENIIIKMIILRHIFKKRDKLDTEDKIWEHNSKCEKKYKGIKTGVWERRINRLQNKQCIFLRGQQIIRYVLVAIMVISIIGANLPFFDRPKEEFFAFIGPLFAYTYLLGIYEYVLYRKKGWLDKKSLWIFAISFLGGAILGYLFLEIFGVFKENAAPTFLAGMEIFPILIFILLGFEIALRVFLEITPVHSKKTKK